jgi:hypothetical protein
MIKRKKLPLIKDDRRINIKEFVKLARKVRQSFIEEEEYLRRQGLSNGNNSLFEVPFDS